jgi:hypothetical protein
MVWAALGIREILQDRVMVSGKGDFVGSECLERRTVRRGSVEKRTLQAKSLRALPQLAHSTLTSGAMYFSKTVSTPETNVSFTPDMSCLFAKRRQPELFVSPVKCFVLFCVDEHNLDLLSALII